MKVVRIYFLLLILKMLDMSIWKDEIKKTASNKSRHRNLFMPKLPGLGGDEIKAKDDFSYNDESKLKLKKNFGISMRVDRPEEVKPLYISMSPIYDYRKYLII